MSSPIVSTPVVFRERNLHSRVGSKCLFSLSLLSPCDISTMSSLTSHLPPPLFHVLDRTHLTSNPLNQLLLVLVIYLIYISLPSIPSTPATSSLASTPSTYNWRPRKNPSSNAILWREFTPLELRPYDGTSMDLEDGRILFAIRRKIYDVTGAGGRGFYGPGGPYSIFAGRDASRGLAKQSFEPDMLTPLDQPIDALDDLTSAEWDNLKDWESHFKNKYVLCGDYVESK